MEAVEAVVVVVVGVSETADGAQKVELEARCPAAEFERADVVDPWRVAVPLELPLHKVLVSLRAGGPRARVRP